MKRYHVFRLVEDRRPKPTPILSSNDAMAKAILELKRDMEETITGNSSRRPVAWIAEDLGRHDRQNLQLFGVGNEDLKAFGCSMVPVVFFDRGGDVAIQVLPQVSHPAIEYASANAARGVAFGFDYIDLKGNYRAADGAIIFNGPTNGELKMRDDGTMAFSG